MKIRSVPYYKEKLLKLWVFLLNLINKLCLLASFILIPILLGLILTNLYKGIDVTALVQTVILVLVVHINKEL